MTAPSVVLLGGPNGAGKTTSAPELIQGELQVVEFVNADSIAHGLSAFAPETVSLEAGRLMLAQLRRLAARRASFAFETTLASRSFAPWLRGLIADGYAFHLVFLWLPSADLCVNRVAERARMGGHFVPEDVIRRRYDTGLRNFFTLYRPLAVSWEFYDSSNEPHLIASFAKGRIGIHDEIWHTIEERHGAHRRD